jgi:UDP-N-acetylenolpyruvoylglucosamine reductase
MFAPLAAWLLQRRIPFQENAAVAPYLALGIGGAVRLLIRPRDARQRLAVLRHLAGSGERPYLVIGGGSNIAFPDVPVRAAVLLTQGEKAPAAPLLLADEGALEVDAGMRNQPFLAWCAASGAGGLEFLSGIPGTLGGAAAVNAGAFGRSMADMLLAADIVDGQGRKRRVDAAHFGFRYRDSRLKLGSEALLTLRLRHEPASGEAIAARTRENLEYRVTRHPSYRLATAGCFFKNPQVGGTKIPAGKIIEESGLKSTTLGALAVAAEHANFLINRGGGTFADLQRLEEKIRAAVAERTGILLEREVIYVSPEGKKY